MPERDRSRLQAVLARLNIESFYSEFMQLRGRGDERAAFCPFHENTDTEALGVNVRTGRWLCRNPACAARGDVFDFYMRRLGASFPEALAELERRAGVPQHDARPPLGPIVTTYDYHDDTGTVLYQVTRHFPPKDFRQRRPNGRGGWIWGLDGIQPVPFHLPRLIESVQAGAVIYIAEGEKDVLALERLGLAATCNSGGAGKWRHSFAFYFSGAAVVILADNDEAGTAHACQVAASLWGSVTSIKLVELPGLRDKGDVSDWLAAGGTRNALEQLVAATPEWTPASTPETPLASTEANQAPRAAEGFTDTANSARLVRLHGERIRYVARWGVWLVFADGHWQRDPGGVRVGELAKDVGRDLLAQAAAEADEDRRKKLASWAVQSSNAGRIRAMVELARGMDGVLIEPDVLDTHPWLLCVRNGVVDLRTGAMRAADPADLMTMQAPVIYDPAATAPRFERAVAEWFPDEAVRAYVQRVAGAALAGEQVDHILVIHYGNGRNGKGTFVRALQRVLGPYAVTPHMSLLVELRHAEHDTIKASLFRARLAVASETERRVKLAEASVKNLTGRDRITCRRLYENPWEFEPSHSLWLQTNYLPEIGGRDHGIWSRIRVVPWTRTFEHGDENLETALAQEAPGILNWMIRGCLDWQQHGLDEPHAVRMASAQYRHAEDKLLKFAEDTGLRFAPDLTTSDAELKQAFRDWKESEGVRLEPKELNDWLEEHGARKRRPTVDGARPGRVWFGVGITSAVHSVHGLPVSPYREPSLENLPAECGQRGHNGEEPAW